MTTLRYARLLSALLETEGHRVLAAEDGQQGVGLFRSESPDLVITALIMPRQEGIETIVELRRSRPDTKIIAISGGGQVGGRHMLKMAQVAGATDIVMKPFDPDDFMHRVAACLVAAAATCP
jgi:DNA-binding response OmpR family regulator